MHHASRPRNGRLLAPCLAAVLVVGLAGCNNAPPPAPVQPALNPAARAALAEELRASVRAELREELRAELKQELRRELRKDLESEVRRAIAAEQPGLADGSPPTPPPTRDGGARPATVSLTDTTEGPGTTMSSVDGPVRLVELAVGTNVIDRTPQDVSEHYPDVPDMLYCYSAIESREPDQSVVHVWRRDGMLVSRVELEVGKSPRWKTWSKQKPLSNWTGNWSCEVVTAEGDQLGVTRFVIGR